MNAALLILGAFLALAFVLGLLARRGRTMTFEQWTVGGRGFGPVFVFLLLASEIYTTFTFLGASGWAYGKGAPAFYILAYGVVAYALSYVLLPVLWRHARTHRLHSQADFFAHQYRSPLLGVIVALVGVAAIVPYLVLQLRGLGIIVSETSYGRIPVPVAIVLSVVVLVAYVVVSGVRGSAWTAVVKDAMILVVAVGLGLWLPHHYYGGIGPMFAAVARAKPGFLALPATGMSTAWFVSTVLLSALGFYMWPHGFASVYTARSGDVFRANAVLMPLYQLVLLFVLFVGFAAILQVPGLAAADADLSLLRLCRLAFGPTIVGLIGAAGLLTALVPGSMLLLTGATILAKNVVAPLWPGVGEARIALLARWFVPVVALVGVVFTLRGGAAIVSLLLLGYNLVTQLFPALVLALPARPWATSAGAISGILVGEGLVAWLLLSGRTLAQRLPGWPHALTDLNPGLVALVANALVVVLVSAATRGRHAEAGALAAGANRE